MINKLRKILATPTTQFGQAGRFFVFNVKLWGHCIRLLRKNRAPQLASALAYNTIFGIVPLLIVVLLIFQSLPASADLRDKVKEVVYRELNLSTIEYSGDVDKPGEQIQLTAKIDQIIESFFTESDKKTITVFSVILIIWAAIALLSTIERAFNQIWGVARGRNFVKRIINYWAVLTLGPLLLGAGIYVSAKLSPLGRVESTVLATAGSILLSFIISAIVFFLLYFVLPNTRVSAKAALWGALAAAVVWIAARNFFSLYLTEWKPYSTMYGVMALVPITVFWIYVTWLIVLFGLQLTFTTQHLKTLDAAEIAAAVKREDHFIANDVTAINVVRQISAAFEERKAPVEPEIVSTRLNMPPELTEKMLNHLVKAGILVKTSDPRTGFMPATDPANIRLSEISQALAAASFAQQTPDQPAIVDDVVASNRAMLAQHNVMEMLTEMRRHQL